MLQNKLKLCNKSIVKIFVNFINTYSTFTSILTIQFQNLNSPLNILILCSQIFCSMDYLKGLNESQYEAVTSLQGPLMVLAGAGSGKHVCLRCVLPT
jgi:hypothetical protein